MTLSIRSRKPFATWRYTGRTPSYEHSTDIPIPTKLLENTHPHLDPQILQMVMFHSPLEPWKYQKALQKTLPSALCSPFSALFSLGAPETTDSRSTPLKQSGKAKGVPSFSHCFLPSFLTPLCSFIALAVGSFCLGSIFCIGLFLCPRPVVQI